MTKQRIFFWLVTLSLHPMVQAQGHDAHWIFGMGYHMEFVGGTPIMHPRVDSFVATEGASCISDKDGNLLFYSNTQRIWNANHEPLWNSDSINSRDNPLIGSSITNGSLFLPWPGDTTDRYFAFIVRGENDPRLFISRIDRALDGGLGGIEVGFKSIPIVGFNVGEQLTAVRHGNGRDWWLITRRQFSMTSSTNSFYAILLGPEGIVVSIVSEFGLLSDFIGELAVSRNGERIALASFKPPKTWIGLFAFDRCSGSVDLIDSLGRENINDAYYGLAFNSNSDRLYASSVSNGSLYQFDWLSGIPNMSLVFSLDGQSATWANGIGQLESATNGDIYVPYSYSPYVLGGDNFPLHTRSLGVLRQTSVPELILDTFAIALPDTLNLTLSLPHFPNYELGALIGSPCDSLSPPMDTTTSITLPIPEQADWSVNPTVGRDRFVVTGVPVGAELVVFDAFGRKAGTWTVSGDPFRIQVDAWPPGLYWMVAKLPDGLQLPVRRIVKTGN